MIDNKIIELAHRQIQLACEEQKNLISQELNRLKAEMNKRGMYHSSNHILAIQDVYAKATSERINFAWEILLRCITTVGVTYDESLEEQLKATLDTHFPEHMNGLKYAVQEAAQSLGMPQVIPRLPDAVGDAHRIALRKAYSEIELFILKLKQAPIEQPYIPYISIHNSNIGALQTGNSSVANVNQQVNSDAIQAIEEALTAVAQSLANVEALPQNDKLEVIELVHDGLHELKKDKPNHSKLKSFISTIGSAISFTADLKPAYDALKSAATMIGLALP